MIQLILTILTVVLTVSELVRALVLYVESPGDGPAKRAYVIERARAAIEGIPQIPALLKQILMSESLLSALIDAAVWGFHRSGLFKKGDDGGGGALPAT